MPIEPASTVPPPELITWFGQSRRLIGARPDSLYGWWPTEAGPCIVKALDTDLVAYADNLLQHERQALRRLAALGAPAARLIEIDRPDWLVTRFAGLSLQHLQSQGPAAQQPETASVDRLELIAAWHHLMRRLQPVAEAGVLIVDLHPGNVVLPLTQGVCGQLRLTEVTTIDHAHTLEAGMDIRRPVWIHAGMRYLAPELRSILAEDQAAFEQACQAAGFALSDLLHHPQRLESGSRGRHFWASYDAPQQLQRKLDDGQLDAGRAMQFAIGTALLELSRGAASEPGMPDIRAVAARMTQPAPLERYATLDEAARALHAACGALPKVGAQRLSPVLPQDLAARSSSVGPTKAAVPAAEGGTVIQELGNPGTAPGAIDSRFLGTAISDSAPAPQTVGAPLGAATTAMPEGRPAQPALPWRWWYACAALGALAGSFWPA
ncbi:MAG: hypothetical protein JNJ71_19465 [Rubrivivax sp.]|nr:hypothetical protein [Rubrivivax sp.]